MESTDEISDTIRKRQHHHHQQQQQQRQRRMEYMSQRRARTAPSNVSSQRRINSSKRGINHSNASISTAANNNDNDNDRRLQNPSGRRHSGVVGGNLGTSNGNHNNNNRKRKTMGKGSSSSHQSRQQQQKLSSLSSSSSLPQRQPNRRRDYIRHHHLHHQQQQHQHPASARAKLQGSGDDDDDRGRNHHGHYRRRSTRGYDTHDDIIAMTPNTTMANGAIWSHLASGYNTPGGGGVTGSNNGGFIDGDGSIGELQEYYQRLFDDAGSGVAEGTTTLQRHHHQEDNNNNDNQILPNHTEGTASRYSSSGTMQHVLSSSQSPSIMTTAITTRHGHHHHHEEEYETSGDGGSGSNVQQSPSVSRQQQGARHFTRNQRHYRSASSSAMMFHTSAAQFLRESPLVAPQYTQLQHQRSSSVVQEFYQHRYSFASDGAEWHHSASSSSSIRGFSASSYHRKSTSMSSGDRVPEPRHSALSARYYSGLHHRHHHHHSSHRPLASSFEGRPLSSARSNRGGAGTMASSDGINHYASNRGNFSKSASFSAMASDVAPATGMSSTLPYIHRKHHVHGNAQVTTRGGTQNLPSHSSSTTPSLTSHYTPPISNSIQKMIALDNESLELEHKFQYYDAIKKMRQCIDVMQQVYGTPKHEQISLYVERCVAMCNTYAHQYMNAPAAGIHAAAHHSRDEYHYNSAAAATHQSHLSTSGMVQQDMDTALTLLKIAIKYCDKQSPFEFSSKSQLLILSWNNVASYYKKKGELNLALRYAQKAFEYKQSIWREASQQQHSANNLSSAPANLKIPDNPAGLELNMGTILSLMGHHHEALKFSRLALNILLDEDLLMDDSHRHFPDEESRRKTLPLFSSLVIVHHNIAVELEHLDRAEEAFRWHVKAASIARNKLGDSHALSKDMQYALEEFERFSRQHEELHNIQQQVIVNPFMNSQLSFENDASTPVNRKLQFDNSTHNHSYTEIHSQLNTGHTRRYNHHDMLPAEDGAITTTGSEKPRPDSTALVPASSSMGVYRYHPSLQQQNSTTMSHDLVLLDSSQTPSQSGAIMGYSEAGTYSSSTNSRGSAVSTSHNLILGPTPPPKSQKSKSFSRHSTSQTKSRHSSSGTASLRKYSASSSATKTKRKKRIPRSFRSFQAAEEVYLHKTPKAPSTAAGSKQTFRRKFKSTKAANDDWVASSTNSQTSSVHEDILSADSTTTDENVGKKLFHIQQRQLSLQSQSALVIQCAWRTYQAKKEHAKRRQFILNYSARSIQNVFRGFSVRKNLRKQQQSVITLQKVYRRHAAEIAHENKHTAALIIQRSFKQWLQLSALKRQRKAAIRLQRNFRGYSTRDLSLKKWRASVLLIQRSWRALSQKLRLQRQTDATLCIQKHWRDYLARREYKRQFKLHVTVLKLWRMKKARDAYNEKKQACLSIQTWWRVHRDQNYHRKLQWAARVVQDQVSMNLVRQDFVRLQRATVFLQARHRKRSTQRWLQHANQAAATIARQWLLYSTWKTYAQLAQKTLVLQRAVRLHQTRKRMTMQKKAATTIQACWRRYQAVEKYQQMQFAVLPIQRRWRISMVHAELERQNAAQCRIVSVWRRYMQQKITRREEDAAVLIQTVFCGYSTRQKLHIHQHACVKIQRVVRHMLSIKKLERERIAALIISRCFKGYQCRKELKEQSTRVRKIQRWTRHCLEEKRLERERVAALREKSASLLQSWWRKHLVHKQMDIEHNASVCIQSLVKMRYTQNSIAHMNQEAIRIQRQWNMYKVRHHIQQQHTACTRIQSWWRMHLQQKQCQRRLQAAKALQNWARSTQIRKRYLEKQEASIVLQCAWRRYQLHKRVLRNQMATRIASMYRAYQMRKSYERQLVVALKIQRVWRSFASREAMKRQNEAIFRIQHCWTRYREEKRRQLHNE